MTAAASPWDFFDRIYCITLEDRTDRRTAAAAEFSKVGILPKVEFVSVRRHPENSEQGIFESHLGCIERGLAAGARTIAIFEDDVVFDRYAPDTLARCLDFLSEHRRWSVLFFGCLVKGSRPTAIRPLLQIRYRSLAHAYAINRPFAERLAKKRWEGAAFDAMLRSEPGLYFSVYPAFAFQSDSPTDNMAGVRLDRFRRWCGGLCRIQKMNEFYHRHRTPIIAAHVLAILAIALAAASAFGAWLP
jgi:GR25 family glycosyltransferase involved in LPS biosynthesis